MAIELPVRIAFLKKIHLFHSLEEPELALIAEKLQEKHYSAGSVIFEQGRNAENFYLIYEGTVRITRRQDRKDILLARLVKEDYFGEMGLIVRRPRSGTAIALDDTSLLVIAREDFRRLYKQNTQLRRNFDLAIQSRKLARKLQFDWLRPEEVIYFLARKHVIILYQKLVWALLALLVPLFFLYAWFAIARFAIVALASAVSFVAIVLWIFWLWVDWGNDYYIVTDRRVVWLEKVVGIYDSRQESPLSTILSVGVETSQLGRLLDYGNVIVRTWVGRVPFNHVSHPAQAQRMVEEYWNRTKASLAGSEKEAMKDALRKQLGIPAPPAPPKVTPDVAAATPKTTPPRNGMTRLLRLLGAETLKLRYETGESVFYRKHWFVLIEQAWLPLAGILGAFVLLISRFVWLASSPDEALLQIVNGALQADAYSLAILIALVPLFGWLIYQVMDWSNDQFEVTPEQIIDLDKKPFGTQTRNAAQLDSILGTEAERIGILGQIFNYGNVYITVGGSKLAFEDVMDPASVQSDIDRRREARKAKQDAARVAAERDRMAEWLATYHRNAGELTDELRREEEKKNQKLG